MEENLIIPALMEQDNVPVTIAKGESLLQKRELLLEKIRSYS